MYLIGALVVLLTAIQTSECVRTAFNPREYHKDVAICNGDTPVTSGNAVIHYVDINPKGKSVMLMVHGWPGLWSTWSHQIQEFRDEYHLLLPDLRGFGSSTHKDDTSVTAAAMQDLVGDLVCVLSHARVDSAICVGHDWGSQLCYEAARMRPDIFAGVVGITVPYIPSDSDFVPVSALVDKLPRLTYQLFFNRQRAAATAELDHDVRRTVRATLRSVHSPPPDAFLTQSDSFLRGWAEVPEIPPVPFLTPEEEDYMVEQYSIQGFAGTLHFYGDENRYRSWQFDRHQKNYTVSQPVLSILPLNDPVADWVLVTKILGSERSLPRLTSKTSAGAHWVHMENPKEVNKIMRTWLQRHAIAEGRGLRGHGLADEF